jgi:hypothetical protein
MTLVAFAFGYAFYRLMAVILKASFWLMAVMIWGCLAFGALAFVLPWAFLALALPQRRQTIRAAMHALRPPEYIRNPRITVRR